MHTLKGPSFEARFGACCAMPVTIRTHIPNSTTEKGVAGMAARSATSLLREDNSIVEQDPTRQPLPIAQTQSPIMR